MKTIALKEETFQILESLKRKKKAPSFDELIATLVVEEVRIPSSMFGALKGKMKRFTEKERKEMWKEDLR